MMWFPWYQVSWSYTRGTQSIPPLPWYFQGCRNLWQFQFTSTILPSYYIHLIQEYGSLNGICSSIMENKHIKAVKEPWRISSKWQAMHQMLISNQHMDKLAASHTLFKSCGMLKGVCLSDTLYQLCEKFDFLTTATTNWHITSQIKNIWVALMKISLRSAKKMMTTILWSTPLMILLMFNWQKQSVSGYMSLASFSSIFNPISTLSLPWSACYGYWSTWPSSLHPPISCSHNWTQLQHLWVRPLWSGLAIGIDWMDIYPTDKEKEAWVLMSV